MNTMALSTAHPSTVLVIDDEATHRVMARDCLEEEGYRVLEATSGDIGLGILREQRVDLVLLDLMMPGRDGYAICHEIRSDPELQHIPVIMVTGSDDLDAVHRAFAARADDFVTKPVHWKLLPYRVRFTLRNLQTSNALRIALLRSQAADDAKAEFLAAMGHELRTPLNAIIGFSEMIAKPSVVKTSSEKNLEYAGYILGSGHRLLGMINSILEMVKLQEGSLVLEVEPVDLAMLLETSAAKFQHQCESNAHDFTMRIEAGLPAINADPRRLSQIALNLVTNAVTFTPAGGRIEVAARRHESGGAEIVVSDNGIGMSPPGGAARRFAGRGERSGLRNTRDRDFAGSFSGAAQSWRSERERRKRSRPRLETNRVKFASGKRRGAAAMLGLP
jgi:signal transduction histidine kinase